MTRQRKTHEERKDEIVRGALELAAERGVKEVTAQAIADRVGIAQPTVFRHFKSRDAIFRAAMEWIAHSLFKVLEGLGRSGPADARLQRLLARQLAFVSKQPGLPRLLFSDRLHLEDPELKATVRRVMERYVAHVEGILRDGVKTGRF
ncbi:MAG: TetR/AcrR family transcriptional regulator, partial [Gammaproteobacteria bacterium]|nr:TetR/AcrR family transcriptional regulator [Gammaproteobacteria bacterium]NIR97640.1 TetR/AcrR family transcriptional regulator [Gammaproteobacteria bacterium]NIT63290.1 TetR/AcrR family transcriptional regulator [Gammaproteobacteria bacterium]NIV20219.1 TetR family transcriptional regulator [Gammaproteobacteria bacterium]NIY31870.1 TetR family transcriptional regulator [Gammaproteobacteria bacterium]